MRATFLSGTEVTVRVANSALQEYDVDDSSLETAKTAAAYIEAVPGANFVIEVKLAPSFPYTKDCVECQLYIDGNWVCGELIDLTKVKSRGRTLHLDGCEENINGGAVLRRFTFAEHQATDGAARSSRKDKFAKLGEITVKLIRCRVRYKYDKDTTLSFQSAAEEGIPEKAMKGRAIGAHTTLGPAEPVKRRNRVKIPYGKEPLGSFVFKYRTHRDLQVEGIIERSPSPVPLEDRDPGSLNAEEVGELMRRLRESTQSHIKTKQEIKREKRERSSTLISDEEDSDNEVTVTEEGDRRKRARTSSKPADEVIELD